MSSEAPFDGSADFQRFVLLALEIGLDNLQKQHSLIPMVVSARGDEYALNVLAVAAGELMGAAAEHVGRLPVETDYYALVFDRSVDVDGRILSSVIVQAGERCGKHGHMLFQRYDSETYEAVGPPEYGGRAEQWLVRQV